MEVKDERLANDRANRHYSRTLGKRTLNTWTSNIHHHKTYQVPVQVVPFLIIFYVFFDLFGIFM